ncbi:MAG: hypothetical protein J6J24_05415 [Clostridia bacterium]|nr:hypothetical protein [Clostridia bacterium]
MERLTLEPETLTEAVVEPETVVEKTEKSVEEKPKQKVSIFEALKEYKEKKEGQTNQILKEEKTSAYLQSFKEMTVADIMEERRKKEAELFEKEKEILIQKQYEKPKEEEKRTPEKTKESETINSNIIEKPNFDLIEENKKVVKLFKKEKPQKKMKSAKRAGLALACTLAGCGIVCVVNTVLIDNMNKSLLQIDETYNLNLQKYLKEITKLDQTNKSMEFLDTYPDDLLDAGDIGEKSNWFDKLCNFFGGLFGG